MKLLVGLGNPGDTYAMNRHNIGFMAVDRIHERWNGTPFRKKFQGIVAEMDVHGTRVMVLKPMTYMNESGRSVGEAARFFKVAPADIIIAHDEIDLPPGKFRMKTGGGTGGHNGLKSVSAQLGDGFRRLRLGVGHPGRKEMVPSYVLRDFAKADRDWLEPLLDALAAEAPLLVSGQDSTFASRVHMRITGGTSSKAKARPDAADTPARTPAEETTPKTEEANATEPNADRTREKAGGPFAALTQLLRK